MDGSEATQRSRCQAFEGTLARPSSPGAHGSDGAAGLAATSSLASVRGGAAAGFTLIDVLVSIAVIGVLVALMLPGMSAVRESTRRVVCASNLRQVGLGLQMYADDQRDLLPATLFVERSPAGTFGVVPAPQETLRIRLTNAATSQYATLLRRTWDTPWDGVGRLYQLGYLSAADVFYCPSHTGEHPVERYAERFRSANAEIFSNVQFRGLGPGGERRLTQIATGAGLVSDGVRTPRDVNHVGGTNLLRAGLSVEWFADSGRLVQLVRGDQDNGAGGSGAALTPGDVEEFWNIVDAPEQTATASSLPVGRDR